MSIFTKINKGTSDFQTKTARNLKFSLNCDELVVALYNKVCRHKNIKVLIYIVCLYHQNSPNCPKISVFGPKNSVFGPK